MTLATAFKQLVEALDARGAARDRARAEVDRQFAAIIKRRTDEYAAALAREKGVQQ